MICPFPVVSLLFVANHASGMVPPSLPPAVPVTTSLGVQALHRAVLGMAPPVASAPAQLAASAVRTVTSPGQLIAATQQQPIVQPSAQVKPQPTAQLTAQQVAIAAAAVAPIASAQTPATEAKAAANAASAATNAANAAMAAASTAANAAASAHIAATAAASTNIATSANSVAGAPFLSPAGVASVAATNAQIAAVAAANTATNAAAAANIAANAAASANLAASAAAGNNAAANAITFVNARSAEVPVAIAFSPVTAPPPSSSWSTPQYYVMQAYGLFAGLSFVLLVKALCIASNVLVQVSPFPSVMRWDVRGCTGESDPAPYVSIAFGGCQWSFYGIFAWLVTSRSGFLVLVHSNILGALLGIYYVATYVRNCRNENSIRSLQKYVSAVTALALLQICAMSVLPAERALFLIGIISSFCSFINATSVLVTVPCVIRTQDSRSIPGPYAIANLLSSLIWTLCGYILADSCVMMPNAFSTLCCIAALGLKVYYPSKEDGKLLSVEDGRKDWSIPMTSTKAHVAAAARKVPKEFTPMKPSASKTSGGTFAEHTVKDAGPVKILEASAAHDGDGCGTGGTC